MAIGNPHPRIPLTRTEKARRQAASSARLAPADKLIGKRRRSSVRQPRADASPALDLPRRPVFRAGRWYWKAGKGLPHLATGCVDFAQFRIQSEGRLLSNRNGMARSGPIPCRLIGLVLRKGEVRPSEVLFAVAQLAIEDVVAETLALDLALDPVEGLGDSAAWTRAIQRPICRWHRRPVCGRDRHRGRPSPRALRRRTACPRRLSSCSRRCGGCPHRRTLGLGHALGVAGLDIELAGDRRRRPSLPV